MVNLDGAFATANDNMQILGQVSQMGVPVQFGGGLRALDDISRAIDQGATRIVLGTVAIKQPEIVVQAVAKWGVEAICVALSMPAMAKSPHMVGNRSRMSPRLN